MSRGIQEGVARRSIFAAALVGIVALFAAGVAQATTQTLIVTTTADSGPGSLRAAITQANADTGDTINFSIDGPGPFTITLTSGPLPTITSSMNIIGGTTQATGITISGNRSYRVLDVGTFEARDLTLNLNNLTITHGLTGLGDGDGAGIAIAYATVVNVTNCTLVDNTARTDGGAIFTGSGTLNVTNSTFSGNAAAAGGAILVLPNLTLNVTNSTFSGNSANDNEGGGINLNVATANLKGTILSANTGGNCFSHFGKLTDKGYNISDDRSCGFTATGSADGVNPNLGVLANNGGPTMTFALKSDSPAIDAIPQDDCTYLAGPNPCTTSGSIINQLTCDQRGFIRPALGQSNCDIGAVEGVAAPTLGAPGASCEDECRAEFLKCVAPLDQCLSRCRGNERCEDFCGITFDKLGQSCREAEDSCLRGCSE